VCGIAGLILPNRAPFHGEESHAIVAAMTAALAHRGPDDRGLWADPDGRSVLGHRRLSIIDTSAAGHQPFASGDGRWITAFNGEIYNFQELRPRLSSQGATFRSRSDTEVLVEAVAHWGLDALSRLDGMFAFAAFDTLTGTTLLARDPFGEKPLYYMPLPEHGVAFASELQALQLVPGFDRALDPDALAELLCFQYIGAPRSAYRSVRKLPAGHWMTVDARGAIQIERYFAFEPGSDTHEGRSTDDLVDELEDILVRGLGRRLISDVPLGAFLSGGVDSSTVCALAARKLDRSLTTFSVGFRDHPESEHAAAASFAESIGTDHRTLLLDPRAAESIPRLGALLDEPNGDSSCLPTLLLSEFARAEVTVALSGDGGDEMFGGYGRYASVVDAAAVASRTDVPCRVGDEYYGSRLLVGNEHHIWGLFGDVPNAFAEQLHALRADLDLAQPSLIGAMRRHDVDRYLPGAVLAKVDRMSMRHGLEVRTPFLSVELAQFAQRIPDRLLIDGGRSKILLRELAYRYLPRHLVDLPKQGFGLPQTEWTSATLHHLSASLVEGDDSRLGELFGRERVDEFLRSGRESGSLSVYFVWSLLVLESWLRANAHTRG
jgi:asparagine synthase (glutamine-hydrolysing)